MAVQLQSNRDGNEFGQVRNRPMRWRRNGEAIKFSKNRRRRQILFITHRWIGDAILASGVLAHLIERHPEAHITVACGPNAVPLFEAVPNLTRIIPMPKRKWAGHWLRLWMATVGHFWDTVVDLRGSAISYFLAARHRWPRMAKHRWGHMVEQHAHVIGLDEGVPPRLWTTAEHVASAAYLIPAGSPVLALGPIANWPGKEWPAARFAELARRLTAPGGPLAGGRIAVFGGAASRKRAETLFAALPAERCIDLVGVDLLTAYECLKRCALFVGNDSGTMHLAAAAGTPTLGLFGPSREALFRPWGANCRAIRTPESFEEIVGSPGYDFRKTDSLLDSLSVDAVEAEAQTMVASGSRP